ncbi:MAG TPA: hypothetical protein VFD66_10235 [Verrucomicrobiae bacterium]|nr:hypothetical protein [Verrucomicrobiae bacterium]
MIRISDDENAPVQNATVALVGQHWQKVGRTDSNGVLTVRLHVINKPLDVSVDKEGYYPILWHRYDAKPSSTSADAILELQLHKRGKPCQMIVKKVNVDMHERERAIGYDLEQGDWVKPTGSGKISDFLIKIDFDASQSTNQRRYLRLSCPNSSDGLLMRRFFWRNDYGLRLPALAPETGYSNVWEWHEFLDGLVSKSGCNVLRNGDQDANFYFRIRSKTNEYGRVVSCMYGKIYYGIQFGSATYLDKMPLRFLYYLNPDGTRNTEWDTRSNLCPNPGDVGAQP